MEVNVGTTKKQEASMPERVRVRMLRAVSHQSEILTAGAEPAVLRADAAFFVALGWGVLVEPASLTSEELLQGARAAFEDREAGRRGADPVRFLAIANRRAEYEAISRLIDRLTGPEAA